MSDEECDGTGAAETDLSAMVSFVALVIVVWTLIRMVTS